MGVDVFKSYHTELGILDTGMYDHDLVYGVSPGKDTQSVVLSLLGYANGISVRARRDLGIIAELETHNGARGV